jgi:FAD/FMN-containing dehydrogenase/uncharacterized membrane protein
MPAMTIDAARPDAFVRTTRALAVACLLGMVALGLAWELWLARTGSGAWAIKVLPLAWPLAGLLKLRLYTYRWVSLLVWLYVAEGLVRGPSGWGIDAALAWAQVALGAGALCGYGRARALAVVPSPPQRRRGGRVTHPLLQILRGRIGATQVLTEGDLSAWELDWRRRWRGRALAVVRPGSTDEVADVLRACAAHGVTVVPQGGNTGLVGGGVPDDSGTQVLLSLSRLNRVRRIDTANLTITAEAGCVLQALQAKVEEAGLLFPLSMASQGSCTIGGNLATNAGGTQVLRYGNARELCLGLEVVNAAGEVWGGLSGLRKDNTGYDLRDLFIGSEGTLGVITAATLKLYPRPAASAHGAGHLRPARAVRGAAEPCTRPAGCWPDGFEVMNRFSLELVRRHFPALPQPLPPAAWTVLIEHADHESEAHARDRFEALLADALEAGVIGDAAVAESLSQAPALWHVRESIPLAQSEEGLNIKHDISLPVSAIAAFASEADVQLQSRWPGIRLVNFGHLGDGNLHYNVQAPVGVDPALFLQTHEADVNHVVYDLVQLHDGSISAEHGVGVLKRDELVQRKSPQALQLMRAIKQALDPSGLLNPGRVL